MMRLMVVLAMLFSIAGGPVVASSGMAETGCVKKNCCRHMACCAMQKGQPAQEKPAPLAQRVGQEIAATVLNAPFSVLFTWAPAEVKRAPRELFAGGHGPEPRSASCIQLI
jgi:hypothetical protein